MVAVLEPTVPFNPALLQQAPLPTPAPAPTLVGKALAHALWARQDPFSFQASRTRISIRTAR